MRRFVAGLGVFLIAVSSTSQAQTPSEFAATRSFIASLQNDDGGFSPRAGEASSLGATSSAIRILGNTRGSIPDVLGCIKFVRSCVQEDSGGFAPRPGGKPDVATTSTGLMAIVEMKIAEESLVDGAVRYLTEHAKTFEEIRIAVAGLEAVKRSSPRFAQWTTEILHDQNPDGTFGEGATKARDTGGKTVALLRMNAPLEKKDAVVAYLKSAQRPDGAGSGGKDGSELETTYRIMRAFFMWKERPDLERLAGFLAKCRHPQGGYGTRPGAEASLAGTYFATTVAAWVRALDGEPPYTRRDGFSPLFNGKDLAGWEGDNTLWSVKEGVLVGTSKGLAHNNFLAAEGSWSSFLLKVTFRLLDGKGNSGVQFRSVRIPGHEMSGYQADIGENFWGCLYDESRRNRVLVQASEPAKKAIRKDGWNEYTIDANRDDIRLSLNGVNSVTYHEAEPGIAREGRVAVQIHAGEPMRVQFKSIDIQPLPDPKEDSTSEPGFHLRSWKSGGQDRKYTVYLPKGYDGTKEFPVILFLHGAGERGKDGVRSAQVGLGPAVLRNPDRFPAIVVFPQARETWKAGSEDARAAIEILDQVIGSVKARKNGVIVTGLSMGGQGSWDIAAEAPDRFVAVVPICGRGKTESARSLAALPVWTFVGDDDSPQTVLNTRAMVEAIARAKGKARLTEYRKIGHNSWDLAYDDRSLIDWMFAQTRR
ncbi:MAG: hypothetical protein NVSMB9_13480 [Isosphaeraceae bacterium]